jgi:peptidylprolyl isomerase
VTVHYVGYLYDSTKADGKGAKVESSVDAGIPLTGTVGVGALRTGWDQALLGMQPGGKRTACCRPTWLRQRLARQGDAQRHRVCRHPGNAAGVRLHLINVTKAVTIPNVPPPTT